MKTGDKIIFTVRNKIKSEPRVSQIRTYVEPFAFRQACALEFILAVEKDKERKADKNKLQFLKTEITKLVGENLSRHDYFSDGSVYLNCLGKFVETKEGWYNSKKI